MGGETRIRADLTQRAAVDTNQLPWCPSPLPGVERRMIERQGDEVARATSIVRYAAGSHFSAHVHAAGEELFVLDGVFVDEHGEYPAGTYVRNPWDSEHTPSSPGGCSIFVKLRQMHPEDRARVVIDTERGRWMRTEVAGLEVMPLHAFGSERVRLERWAPGSSSGLGVTAGGVEVLVLDGLLEDGQGAHGVGSWLRLPPGSERRVSSSFGCTLWVKAGHLGEAERPTPAGRRP